MVLILYCGVCQEDLEQVLTSHSEPTVQSSQRAWSDQRHGHTRVHLSGHTKLKDSFNVTPREQYVLDRLAEYTGSKTSRAVKYCILQVSPMHVRKHQDLMGYSADLVHT
jgi:hypothetical protein